MNILIIGTGYVGLVTGACFAEIGHEVTCLDIDTKKILSLKNGIIPFYEPGLKELVLKNSELARLTFTSSYQESVQNAEVIFLAVPTPSSEDGSCDLHYFQKASEMIAEELERPVIIVNKSTVPVGSAQIIENTIKQILHKRSVDIEFEVVSNPEFLKEGSAVSDCLLPDRIILGLNSDKAETIMKELYAPLVAKGSQIYVMDTLSAEMTKYAANAMLATRISFMNELSLLCERVGANIHEVRKGIGSDRRIGSSFLQAGIGYGGSCFPKDIKALQATAKKNQIDMPILAAVEVTNQNQKKVLVSKMREYFRARGGLQGKTIALLGLAFKPETDDMREAPSLTIIEELQKEGALIKAFDPISLETAKKALRDHSQITWCENEYDTCQSADAVAIITEWKQFSQLDLQTLSLQMNGRAFFDGRNVFDASIMQSIGFHYFGIGIPSCTQEIEAYSLP